MISKLISAWFLSYVGCPAMCTKEHGKLRGGDGLKSFKRSLLRVFHVLLASIEKYFAVPGLRSTFSRGEVSFILNGLFNSVGVYGILERKHNKSVYVIFPFL